jgi:GxxExxY protein
MEKVETTPLKYEGLSKQIIAAAYEVHNELGYGFLEKVYKNALVVELERAGTKCNAEVPLKVSYRGKIVGEYIADLIVENKIIVEVKAVKKLDSVHEVQLVNYLKATGLTVGLLINFAESVQVKRRIFGYEPGQ